VVPVRIIDRQRELGHNSPLVDSLQRVHDVRAFPTLVLVGADGKAIDRMEGFPGSERFMTWVASAGARQHVPKGGATFMFP
jgi:thioredoxin-related protein